MNTSSYIRNIAVLAKGSGLAQLLALLVSPILTRLYGVEDFGTAALFISISSILVVLSSARYEMAIIQARYHFEALSLTIATMLMSIFFFLLLYLIYYLLEDYVQQEDMGRKLGDSVLLIPIYVLALSFANILTNYFNRLGLFRFISLNQILNSITQSFAKIFINLAAFFLNGLIVGAIAGSLVSVCYFLKISLTTIKSKRSFLIGFKSIRKYLRKHQNFPKFTLFSDLFSALSQQAPFFLTAYLFSVEDLGFMALAISMVGLPLRIIGTSISRVFKKYSTDKYNAEGHCSSFVKKNIKKFLIYLTPAFFGLIMLAPLSFKIIFGEQWYVSGEIVQVLAPMFMLQFIARIVNFMYPLTGRHKNMLWIQIAACLCSVLTYFIGSFIFDQFFIAIAFYSSLMSIIYLFTIIKSYQYSKG